MGETKYEHGGSSHNGTRTFEHHEDKILDSLILNKEWVKMIPENTREAINLYEEKYMRKDELLDIIVLKEDM